MGKQKWTADNIPDLSGKVAIVTGANSGLGYASALELGKKNAHVILGIRSQAKADKTIAELSQAVPKERFDYIQLDLGSLASVKRFADTFREKYAQLDILMNNAGIMMVPQGKTEDGFEQQFGVNHLGHFALTGHLLERLTSTPNSRVVNVASIAANSGSFDFNDLMNDKNYVPIKVYQQSKLANLYFTFELQERLKKAGHSTQSLAAHPGGSATNLLSKSVISPAFRILVVLFKPFFSKPAQGALPQLYAATSPEAKAGAYYGPSGFREVKGYPKLAKVPPTANNPDWQKQLWEASESLTGLTFDL